MFSEHKKTIKQKDQDTNNLCSCRYRVVCSPLTEVIEDSSQLKQNEQLASCFVENTFFILFE